MTEGVLMQAAVDQLLAAGADPSAAYAGLGFYAPVFFPEWNRSFSRQEVLNEALSWASRNNQCESMGHLVDLGADVTRKSISRHTASLGLLQRQGGSGRIGCWTMAPIPTCGTTGAGKVTG